MKHFLKANAEWVLGGIGLALSALIIGITVWVVSGVSANLGQALTSGGGAANKIYFKIDELKSINLRGLNPVSR